MSARDYLEMSDEEIMNASAPGEGAETEEPADVGDVQDAEPEAQNNAAEDANEAGSDDATDSEASEAAVTQPGVNPEVTVDVGTGEIEPAKKDDKSVEPEAADIDYKGVYEQLFTPFKANGKEMKVSSVDDVVALMKMGANYSKKMAALKPNLKMLKMLEENKLLDENKIGFLIDLEKRNPQAISKLIKDSGIDPMEIDTEKADDYKPQPRQVQDVEIELDTVLQDIEDTPTYARTLDVLGNKWDAASKKHITNSPKLIKVINDHMQSGVYDVIQAKIESERVYGRLDGVSDIDAYQQVGDAIERQRGFDHLFKKQDGTTPSTKPVAASAPSEAETDRLKDKKRAASPSKPGVTASVAKDFNPLSLSDDAFEKLIKESYH